MRLQSGKAARNREVQPLFALGRVPAEAVLSLLLVLVDHAVLYLFLDCLILELSNRCLGVLVIFARLFQVLAYFLSFIAYADHLDLSLVRQLFPVSLC